MRTERRTLQPSGIPDASQPKERQINNKISTKSHQQFNLALFFLAYAYSCRICPCEASVVLNTNKKKNNRRFSIGKYDDFRHMLQIDPPLKVGVNNIIKYKIID